VHCVGEASYWAARLGKVLCDVPSAAAGCRLTRSAALAGSRLATWPCLLLTASPAKQTSRERVGESCTGGRDTALDSSRARLERERVIESTGQSGYTPLLSAARDAY